ncbi:MAG: ethylbenzene dehydrogenase-related protein [Myxococcota bacterium]
MRRQASIVLGLVLAGGLSFSVLAAEAKGVRAVYNADPVPVRPDAAAWKRAPAATIDLMGQLIVPPVGGGSVPRVKIRAMHDGEWLALRVEWADETADREVRVDRFRDAIAVGFPTRHTEDLPSPFMGDPQHTLNIWQWTADFDANLEGHGGFAKNYPHTEGVWYFAQDYAVQRQVRAWRGTEPVIEFVAAGFGTLERKDSQNVRGLSRYANGRWSVVLRRPLSTGNPHDTHFRPGESTHFVIAVWNGSNGEVNGRKSVTMQWTPLTLDPTVVAARP